MLYFPTGQPPFRRRKKKRTHSKIEIRGRRATTTRGKEARNLWREEKSSGNKALEVNVVCSPKSSSVSSPLNDFNAANKKGSNLMGLTKAACRVTHGFWYANEEEEEMGPTNIKDNDFSFASNEVFQQPISLDNRNKKKRLKEKKDQSENLLFKQC